MCQPRVGRGLAPAGSDDLAARGPGLILPAPATSTTRRGKGNSASSPLSGPVRQFASSISTQRTGGTTECADAPVAGAQPCYGGRTSALPLVLQPLPLDRSRPGRTVGESR